MEIDLLEIIDNTYSLGNADTYGFSSVKAGPLKFNIKHYLIPTIGNLSRMTASGMLGLMKMDTVIITPLQKDAPLLSYDRIIAMGNDTTIVELYDTMLNKSDEVNQRYFDKISGVKRVYNELPDHDLGEHWYDNIKLAESVCKKGKHKKNGAKFDDMVMEYVKAYIAWLCEAKVCDMDKKTDKTNEYVDGLICNGGASTDAFVKSIGKERTAELFHKVLFGC